MPRYIDAEPLKSDIKPVQIIINENTTVGVRPPNVEEVKRIIDEQPTANVQEVVYCKDCIYKKYGNNLCKLLDKFVPIDGYGYCCFGKMRAPFSLDDYHCDTCQFHDCDGCELYERTGIRHK